MKKTVAATLLIALAFTTGFTCSKQTPEQPAPTTPPPAELPTPTQDQMGAPQPGTQTEVPPPNGQPAAPTTLPPNAQPAPAPGAGH